jgi:hypothetical protein
MTIAPWLLPDDLRFHRLEFDFRRGFFSIWLALAPLRWRIDIRSMTIAPVVTAGRSSIPPA